MDEGGTPVVTDNCGLRTACSGGGEGGSTAAKSGLEDGVLTVAMECAYAPYNWTQADDSNGDDRNTAIAMTSRQGQLPTRC
mgnify:CR=1 FL=1